MTVNELVSTERPALSAGKNGASAPAAVGLAELRSGEPHAQTILQPAKAKAGIRTTRPSLAAQQMLPRATPAALVLRRSGDLSEAPEPDPISNSAVKRLSANGTVSQDPGE
jgi:hypothetical protein